MTTEISNIETEWIPPHGLAKGYPWSGIASKGFYPPQERVVTLMNGDDIAFKKPEEIDFDDTERWLAQKSLPAHEALCMAEEQIEYMMEEKPFIPDLFGFEAIVKPQDTTDVPITIYQSKFDENIIIFRKSKSDYGWTIQQKQTEGTMPPIKDIDVTIPCERIAYALFYALGIKVEE